MHATSRAAAHKIKDSGVLVGDRRRQAWLASSGEIAALHNAAGATSTKDAPPIEIETIVEVAVDTNDLFFETTRESDGETSNSSI